MDLSTLWAQIEDEQTWRTSEVRFFQNQLIHIDAEEDQNRFRRAIVLILYSHFEGFCKFAFTHYVNAINNENIKCCEATYAIAAASLADIFHALRHPSSKCPEFPNVTDDEKLHIFARDRQFIEQVTGFDERIVSIVPEKVINLESNLKPIVLRKNLYRLGFSPDAFKSIEGIIDMLLHYRNSIAHGAFKEGIDERTYERLRTAAFKVMDEVKSYVMDALSNKSYLRA